LQHIVTAPAPLSAPLAACEPPEHTGAVETEGAPICIAIKESLPRHVAASLDVIAPGPPAATLQPPTLNFWRLALHTPPAPVHVHALGQLRVSVQDL